MEMARLFLGGRGLGARLLWDEVGPEVDPLSPENVLIFTNGPLTGTGYQTSNRFTVSTKSPLTGTVLDANSGGFWGMQFKRTGLRRPDRAREGRKTGLHRDQTRMR